MEVIWTQEAERQLLVLAEYYRQSAGSVTASGIIQRILDAVACLADSPHVGQYLVRRGQAYRAVMVPAYGRVIYRIVGNKVVIVAVWDCRRDSSDSFKGA
ncbi:MAG TPA: type II toxin-antitoxin system RelE/ParE family toxin [Candidatus Bacteroides avicola]|jgi:plasmid stabilization system protein ParE|uniref:Type II toxin-antitoxin system RelE/ParE family toxin n=1 Tax=Candidatus Bacteroides avicola TaxID=2838468 RepID=A0A9D2HTV6_9BACE|nr:type II toxin-antitoxin system RelE/ParE family toxin [Mediterranea sp. An20]MBW9201459.1 type II toxin-antitoxin system RelE/ParE family toxin [Bacteroidales bacterium SW292]OUP10717.1 hypothetical protein B5F34_04760 [Mediterranea sp. An20]HJA84855.1 type II toxin-antitoxin system RelE/ParE family toxin [Candidatus Bacteroides avicola]